MTKEGRRSRGDGVSWVANSKEDVATWQEGGNGGEENEDGGVQWEKGK